MLALLPLNCKAEARSGTRQRIPPQSRFRPPAALRPLCSARVRNGAPGRRDRRNGRRVAVASFQWSVISSPSSPPGLFLCASIFDRHGTSAEAKVEFLTPADFFSVVADEKAWRAAGPSLSPLRPPYFAARYCRSGRPSFVVEVERRCAGSGASRLHSTGGNRSCDS